jgi:energy-coupling factor transport system ATP-binding protein
MSHEGVKTNVSQALELFGLQRVAQSNPLDLPFVFRKRVAIAAVVAMQRPWTVLDEPTIGQDPTSRYEIVEIINSLLESGRSLIIISHDTEFVFRVCSRIVVMSAGKCIWAGSREEFLSGPSAWADGFVNVAGRIARDLRFPAAAATTNGIVIHLRDRIDGQENGQEFEEGNGGNPGRSPAGH